MLVSKDTGCRMPGVGFQARKSRSSLFTVANQWPAVCLGHTKVSDGTTTDARLKKYQVPHFGDRNTKKKEGRVKVSEPLLSEEKGLTRPWVLGKALYKLKLLILPFASS